MPQIVPIIGSGFFTVGAFLLFQAVLNYLGDAYPEYVASVFASNDFMRCSFGTGFPLSLLLYTTTLESDGNLRCWDSCSLCSFQFRSRCTSTARESEWLVIERDMIFKSGISAFQTRHLQTLGKVDGRSLVEDDDIQRCWHLASRSRLCRFVSARFRMTDMTLNSSYTPFPRVLSYFSIFLSIILTDRHRLLLLLF